jgi:hypothetical protein
VWGVQGGFLEAMKIKGRQLTSDWSRYFLRIYVCATFIISISQFLMGRGLLAALSGVLMGAIGTLIIYLANPYSIYVDERNLTVRGRKGETTIPLTAVMEVRSKGSPRSPRIEITFDRETIYGRSIYDSGPRDDEEELRLWVNQARRADL